MPYLFPFPNRGRDVIAQKWYPASNRIKVYGECKDKIHQENRALNLDMGYLSSRSAILIFLPSSVWGPEQVSSWVSPLSLDPESRSLTSAQGIGCSRCLSVWPRNGFSRKFPNKTWKNPETPCEARPAPRPPWSALLSHQPYRLVMLHFLSPEETQFTGRGTSALVEPDLPIHVSLLPLTPSVVISHFLRLLFLMPGGLGNLVLEMGSLLHPRVPLELFARLRNILLSCLFHRPILELHLE